MFDSDCATTPLSSHTPTLSAVLTVVNILDLPCFSAIQRRVDVLIDVDGSV